MKFWRSAPPASSVTLGLSALGFILLTAMPLCSALAEDASKPNTPAQAKPESQAGKTAKSEGIVSKAGQAVKSKAKAPVISGSAECVRTGQRVIAALARDDSGAASQFHTFYTAFKCSPQNLALSFGCLVNLQKANPGLSNPSQEQVSQCWEQPSEIPKVLPPPPPANDGAH